MALVLADITLIADEPTTALDVTVQAQILELIDRIKREFDIGVVLITHDLGVIADVAQTVMVMYAGRAMELGSRMRSSRTPCVHTHGACWNHSRASTKGERLVDRGRTAVAHFRVPPGLSTRLIRAARTAEPCDKEFRRYKDRGGGHPEACHLAVEDKRRLWAERESRRLKVAV